MGQFRCMGCMSEYEDSMARCPECGYVRNTSPSEPYCLFPETVLDSRYIVGRTLGVGAFAITYLAWDFLNECKVVIKEYFPQAFSSRMPGQLEINTYDGEKARQFEAGLKAFIDEATTLEELSDRLEGIVKVERTFIENSTAYTVMEYVEGVTLDKVFAQGKMPWQHVIQLMKPLLPSISLFHENGMINCNISPDNIIMTRDRQVKLLGFGTSKFATVGSNKNLDVIIKDGYSPVELYRDDVERKEYTDVYSLAAIIYHALTGVVPPSAIDRLNKDTLQAPSALGVDVPESIENSVLNALNVDADHRTQNCEQFLTDLISRKPVARIADAKRKRDTSRLSKTAKIVISSISGLFLCAIAAIFIIMSGPAKVEREIVVVPNLEGLSRKETKNVINDLREKLGYSEDEFKYEIVAKMQMDGKEPNTIVWQDVQPGTEISEPVIIQVKLAREVEPEVEVTIDDKLTMPDINAETKEEAIRLMLKNRFSRKKFGFVHKVNRNITDIKEGNCFGASAKKGEKVEKDRYIEIYLLKVPKKAKPTPSPSPTAKPKPTPKPTKDTKKDAKKDTKKDTKKSGSKKISTPNVEKVTVPDLVGMSSRDAKTRLAALKLRPKEKTVETNDASKHSVIIRTSPGAGAKVKVGTKITLNVGLYEEDSE